MVLAPPKIRYLHHDSPSSDEGFALKSIARTDNTSRNSLAIAAMNLVCADAQSVMNGDNTKFIERSSLAGFCIWIFTIRRLYHWTRCHEPIDLQRTFLFNRRACQGARPTDVRRHVVFYYLLHQPTGQDRVWGLALAVVSLARRQASRELSMFSHSLTEGREGLAGFRPRTTRFFRLSLKTGSFVSAKGPKTMGARAQPRPQAP